MRLSFLRRRKGLPFLLLAIPALLALLLPGALGAEDIKPSAAVDVSPDEILRLGERMYRDGILPSGEPMEAAVKGDISVEATAFTCSSCHLRSGIGSFEGLVYTPPTNGRSLFRPVRKYYNEVEVVSEPPIRPAYTDKTLEDVIRTGIDPTGRRLDDIMPRYMLGEKDMAILISYLKSLSSEFPPGATSTSLHFATVITEDVSLEQRNAALMPLKNYVINKNNQVRAYKRRPKNAQMQGWWASKYAKLSLSEWVLKGPAETWRSQLEEYYRKDPVFALLGGITKGGWRPVHEFSEENQIPCLFPITDFPVISETDWYTLYFSKGFYQEGEAAARYLNRIETLKDGTIVEIVRNSPQGLAISGGFRETWGELGHEPVSTIALESGEPLKPELLRQLLEEKKPAVLLLWEGPEALQALETLGSIGNAPRMLFVSAGYMGKDIQSLPEGLRQTTYVTYPFGLSQEETGYKFDISLMKNGMREDTEKIVKKMNALINVLTEALIEMRGNYYRDNFFDVIGMMQDQKDPLYERLSFGPGQRYASKGCYILQLGKGPTPELVKKSEWVIH